MMTRNSQITTALFLFIILFVTVSNCLAQPKQQVKLQWAQTKEGRAICGSCTVPTDLSWQVWLIQKGESGKPVVISGIIYKADGVTPDSGVIVFLYQADAGGYYHRPKEDVFHPRLYGWLITGKDGRYEIHTVKPSPEILAPEEPAHIHAQIFNKEMPEHFLHEFWFDGDSRISPADSRKFAKLGSFSPIITLTKGKDGISRGVRNIKVKPASPWTYEDE